jgi:hypothetical protein
MDNHYEREEREVEGAGDIDVNFILKEVLGSDVNVEYAGMPISYML